jgi:hypothetical protein
MGEPLQWVHGTEAAYQKDRWGKPHPTPGESLLWTASAWAEAHPATHLVFVIARPQFLPFSSRPSEPWGHGLCGFRRACPFYSSRGRLGYILFRFAACVRISLDGGSIRLYYTDTTE